MTIFDVRLGVHWEAIERVLVEELSGGDPRLLSRILRRLREEAAVDRGSDPGSATARVAASG